MTVIHSPLSDPAILCLNSSLGTIYFHFKSCVDITDIQENLNSPYTQRIRSFISLLKLKILNQGSFLYPGCIITPFEKKKKYQHLKVRGSWYSLEQQQNSSQLYQGEKQALDISSCLSSWPWLGAAEPAQAPGTRNFGKKTKSRLCFCHQGAAARG